MEVDGGKEGRTFAPDDPTFRDFVCLLRGFFVPKVALGLEKSVAENGPEKNPEPSLPHALKSLPLLWTADFVRLPESMEGSPEAFPVPEDFTLQSSSEGGPQAQFALESIALGEAAPGQTDYLADQIFLSAATMSGINLLSPPAIPEEDIYAPDSSEGRLIESVKRKHGR